ncbi:TetR/AcrR family transcriptional regulator [Deinococcus cellulosilyticus]|uniref:TetR family transcriptional regulator n=1 Tax=Deinococcus cellulosilyticus (strain DSM 18568 / NBRC 106333 / KACC 11606 / 5516J-15) TaxID=1223518 RepID=A0A511N5J2_DEIC1|nr:TetR family transcriptional regulator [Deinococcus cellulosilyticus]GEM48139.1 TetR family transcriptional regulator [Deinococcus cellulosilyticus NBRC 106333 = KACC 11606]
MSQTRNRKTASQDRRAAILQAMLELIAERGFHDTPMTLISQRSGASAGIIYHYFENKDQMIHALYREVKLDYARAILKDHPEALPAARAFRQMWLNGYQYHRVHPRETLFMEQFENSPFYQQHGPIPEIDEAFARVLPLFEKPEGRFKNLPLEVIWEMSFGTAARVARLEHISGHQILDPGKLDLLALACWHAVSEAN